MNIVIKKKNLAQKKNIVDDGDRTHEGLVWSPTPYPLVNLWFQIKHKYERRVDLGAKRYASDKRRM